MQLFHWKCVNDQDSMEGSLFLSQIPLFWPSKWHFLKNFSFSARFILRHNLDSHKFVQPFDWKCVNEQHSVGSSSTSEMAFIQKFVFRSLFYFELKFIFGKIFAGFRLEMGQ